MSQEPMKRIYKAVHLVDTDTLLGPAETDAEDLLRQVDVCFVMDATGSMQSYIDATRQELRAFAQNLQAHTLKPVMAYGLVLFRDHPPQDDTFVTQITPLTEKLEIIKETLEDTIAGGGGDGPEAVADGLYDAVYQMGWRKGAHKIILLAGDAPPHGTDYDGYDGFPDGCPCHRVPTEVAAKALEKGITVFCLGIGADPVMKDSFRAIAEKGGGKFVSLGSSSTLIEEIMKLVKPELGKAGIDRLVYSHYAPTKTEADLAASTGLSIEEIHESLIRLVRKEVIVRR